jgi:hypothetical protein
VVRHTLGFRPSHWTRKEVNLMAQALGLQMTEQQRQQAATILQIKARYVQAADRSAAGGCQH